MTDHPLLRRHEALTTIMERFRGVPFEWGKADCWIMARAMLRAMGHRPPATPRYRNALGAKRALKAKGFDTLAEAIDSILPRIAPAAMLPGDIALMEGDDVLDALTICLGEKIFGWHEDAEGAEPIVPYSIKGAWRL